MKIIVENETKVTLLIMIMLNEEHTKTSRKTLITNQ